MPLYTDPQDLYNDLMTLYSIKLKKLIDTYVSFPSDVVGVVDFYLPTTQKDSNFIGTQLKTTIYGKSIDGNYESEAVARRIATCFWLLDVNAQHRSRVNSNSFFEDWAYEEEYERTDDDPRPWLSVTHVRYLKYAKEQVERSGLSPEEYLSSMKRLYSDRIGKDADVVYNQSRKVNHLDYNMYQTAQNKDKNIPEWGDE